MSTETDINPSVAQTRMRHQVWDGALRSFHWLLVVAVAMQYVTAEFELLSMEWHLRFGYLILGLLVFRLLWGVVGSDTARFAKFIRGPKAIAAYLENAVNKPGHNPIGALSVVAMLGLLLLQTISGLFANDEIALYGPLMGLVSADVAEEIADLHELGELIIPLFILLHIGAIAYYKLIKKRDLVTPMITGKEEMDADPQLHFASNTRVLLCVVIAFLVVSLVYWCGQAYPVDVYDFSD